MRTDEGRMVCFSYCNPQLKKCREGKDCKKAHVADPTPIAGTEPPMCKDPGANRD